MPSIVEKDELKDKLESKIFGVSLIKGEAACLL